MSTPLDVAARMADLCYLCGHFRWRHDTGHGQCWAPVFLVLGPQGGRGTGGRETQCRCHKFTEPEKGTN